LISSSSEKVRKMSKKDVASGFRARADVVVPDVQRKGGLSAPEVITSQAWFADYQRELQSSGGRPTNPRWTLKRLIPMSGAAWKTLTAWAQQSERCGTKLAPAQLASFILEDAINAATIEQPPARPKAAIKAPHLSSDDPRFRSWRQPAIFSGCGAP
jgi:hypothetical protein